MFASTNENFWSIWSIDTEDQIRHSLTHSSDRDFHGCTGSPFKRPNSAPTKPKSVIDRNATIGSTGRMQTSQQPSPILKKYLVKVKSDTSLPTTALLGNDIRRHQTSFSASPSRYAITPYWFKITKENTPNFLISHCYDSSSIHQYLILLCRQRFLKVPTMSNLVVPPQSGRTHSDLKEHATHASNEDLPISISLPIQENTHSLKRHVSWSDTSTKSNLNYEVVMPNIQSKEPPEIRIELGNQSMQR